MVERRILIGGIVIFTVLLVVTIIILVVGKNVNPAASQLKQVCENAGTAAQTINCTDASIDPCNDFYRFANGRCINQKCAPVSERMNSKIGPLLADTVHSEERNSIRLAKNFYRSCCVDRLISREQKTKMLQELGGKILQQLDGWPVVQGESWSESKFSLIGLLRKVKDLGFGTDFIFKLSVYVDPKNKTSRWLGIDEGSYETGREYEDYKQLMNEIPLRFIKENDRTAKVKQRIATEMQDVWKFEKKMRCVSYNEGNKQARNNDDEQDFVTHSGDDNDDDGSMDDDGGNYLGDNCYTSNNDDIDFGHNDAGDNENLSSFQNTTINELHKSYSYFNWFEYLNNILTSGMSVTVNEPIMNLDPNFFQKLGEILKSNRTIANYIVWRVLYRVYKLTTVETETSDSHSDYCIDLTSKKFALPVTILYSSKYFNDTSRQAAVTLMEDVRHAFINMIRQVTWMDNATRMKAIDKVENVVAQIGYPSEMFEHDGLEDYYKDLQMETDNFFNNSMQLNVFTQNQMFKTLRTSVNRSGLEAILHLSPNEANAFYTRGYNAMQLSTAVLRGLFFAIDRPQYMNYASFGSFIGHGFTYSVDNNGRKYDLNGKFADWWDSETEAAFLNNSKCFDQQYNSCEDKETKLQVNVKTTKEIADNGGTRAAYNAYRNWIASHGREEPDMKYNQKQLFWISFAQTEGSAFQEANLNDQIRNDFHTPNECRVNSILSNSQEFAQDFSCSVGSEMNPAEKCKIW